MNTRDLIDLLIADNAAPRPRLEFTLAIAMGIGAILSVALFFPMIGFRANLLTAISSGQFIVKFALALVFAASSIGLTMRLFRPDGRPGSWRWAVSAVPLVLAVLVLSELAAVPASQWKADLLGVNWLACLLLIPLFSLAPFAASFIALRQAAPANAGITGAAAGLAAGGIAAVIYATHCPDDSPLFIAAWYSLAIGFIACLGYFAGRRWLAW